MGFWGTLGRIAGAAAPFIPIPGVGPVVGGLIKAGASVGSNLLAGRGGGGGGGSNDVNSGILDYSKMLGEEGKHLTGAGDTTVAKANSLFAPVNLRNERLLSGDQSALRADLLPETDAIGQQFANVRNMIADQPRGGGKTSVAAQLPIEEIRTLANLISQERNAAAG